MRNQMTHMKPQHTACPNHTCTSLNYGQDALENQGTLSFVTSYIQQNSKQRSKHRLKIGSLDSGMAPYERKDVQQGVRPHALQRG